MKKAWLALIFGSALFLAACGGDDSSSKSSGGNNDSGSLDGEALVSKSCTSCHGGNLEGMGSTPGLKDVGANLSEQEILDIIENGKGAMPPGLLKGEEAKAAAAWLATQK